MKRNHKYLRYFKHWRDCCVCGNPVYEKFRITCSPKCSKKYIRDLYTENDYSRNKEKIKKKELKIRKLQEKLSEKLNRKIFLPFKKPEWPKCKKCNNTLYYTQWKFYCTKCRRFVKELKYRRIKSWGKSKDGTYYSRCRSCCTKSRPHYKKGYCYKCYTKLKWARNYNECINCGTTKRKHKGYGLCIICYSLKKRGKI